MERFDNSTDAKMIPHMTKLFFNGNWLGFTRKPEMLVQNLRKSRRDGHIKQGVSIARDIINKEIKYFYLYKLTLQDLFRFRTMHETDAYRR